MRGEVLHFDNEHGFGFITGSDGRRYTFEKTDLRREFPISKGVLVEFQPEADNARDIFSIRGEAGSGVGADFGRFAIQQPPVDTSVWGYLSRALTANYANFRDRAPRKEYWSYFLFWLLAGIGITIVGYAFGEAPDPLGTELPYAVYFTLGFVLVTFVPSLAMQVRRQHDIGLSGWFVLPIVLLTLVVMPVGLVILIVFGSIPSQKHENKWGQLPYGVQP